MYRDASAAKRIIRTAPTAKFGAITRFAGPDSASPRSPATCSSLRPVVPTTAWTPASRAPRGVAEDGLGLGEVDDDVDPSGLDGGASDG